MIEGLRRFKLEPFLDERGMFAKTISVEIVLQFGITSIKEYFFSRSNKNVWRGMHLQVGEHESNRLIYCVHGEVKDFLIDLRTESDSYLEVMEFSLALGDAMDGLFIPAGVAHGFLAMKNNSEIHYISDKSYSKDHDTGINPMSIPEVNRLLTHRGNISISERDLSLPSLQEFIEEHLK